MNRAVRVALAALFATGVATQAQATNWNFTSCGASGSTGPDQTACDTSYGGMPSVAVAAGIQTWTVPATGSYRITASGAAGVSADSDHTGGRGALISGVFALTAGQTLKILVGQPGSGAASGSNGGGGGGSFVVSSADAPMLIAAGGGGTRVDADRNGCRGSISEFAGEGSASSSDSSCPVKSGGAGQGGIVSSSSWGSAGGGFNSDGAPDSGGTGGGRSWANGMLGGVGSNSCEDPADGGFGGGGSGRGCYGGGGGGGYSGGDGGLIAGGGGSYNSGATPSAGVAAGESGSVVITDDLTPVVAATVPVPTVGELGLLAMAMLLGGLGLRSLRRER